MYPRSDTVTILFVVGARFDFEFLKDSQYFLEDLVFHQLVISMMTDAINAQAHLPFFSASFLKQKQHEALVSDLLSLTHESVKLALLSTLSAYTPFSDEEIKSSLTQVKEDSQIKLLSNLSSHKDPKQSASAASSLG